MAARYLLSSARQNVFAGSNWLCSTLCNLPKKGELCTTSCLTVPPLLKTCDPPTVRSALVALLDSIPLLSFVRCAPGACVICCFPFSFAARWRCRRCSNLRPCCVWSWPKSSFRSGSALVLGLVYLVFLFVTPQVKEACKYFAAERRLTEQVCA